MVSTVVDVYNAALSAVRGKGRLATTSDDTREAEECNIWYSQVRDQVQAAARWDVCRTLADLRAATTTRDTSADWTASAPEPQYLYGYSLPSDYLRAWHLARFDRFTISYNTGNSALLLNTDSKAPILIYSRVVSDVSLWPPGMKNAVIYALAASIAGPLTGNSSLQQINFQLANQAIIAARAVEANTNTEQLQTTPPTLRARGYTAVPEVNRYYFPYGQLFEAALTDV